MSIIESSQTLSYNQEQDYQHASTTTSESAILSAELLDYIQIINRSNFLAETLQNDFSLDTIVLYQALDHFTNGVQLSDLERIEYFRTQQSLEQFHRSLEDSLQKTVEVQLTYAMDFYFLGLDATAYLRLEKKKKISLHHQYEMLYFDLLEGNKTAVEFIVTAQKLIANL